MHNAQDSACISGVIELPWSKKEMHKVRLLAIFAHTALNTRAADHADQIEWTKRYSSPTSALQPYWFCRLAHASILALDPSLPG